MIKASPFDEKKIAAVAFLTAVMVLFLPARCG
jgi:hypothetical protein